MSIGLLAALTQGVFVPTVLAMPVLGIASLKTSITTS